MAKREFLVAYDYGGGGLRGMMYAEHEEEIHKAYPELGIGEQRPPWMTEERLQELRDQRVHHHVRQLPGRLVESLTDGGPRPRRAPTPQRATCSATPGRGGGHLDAHPRSPAPCPSASAGAKRGRDALSHRHLLRHRRPSQIRERVGHPATRSGVGLGDQR